MEVFFTMSTSSLVLNIAILVILFLFVLMGWRRGFVYSLCSLLAVFIAFFGAKYVADTFSPELESWLTPRIATQIQSALADHPELAEGGFRVLFPDQDLPASLGDLLNSQTLSDDTRSLIAQTAAPKLASLVAFDLLYLLAFTLILLVWRIVSRALNLVVRLPVLNFCNRSLGAVFGLVKGTLVLCVLGWVACHLTGLLSMEELSQTWLLQGLAALFDHALL